MSTGGGPSRTLPAIDWADEEGPKAAAAAIKTPGVSVEAHRETTRGQLARWLMGLLTLTVLVILGLAAAEVLGIKNKSDLSIQAIAEVTLTPVVTLTGTALGFYFGAQTAKSTGTGANLTLPARRQPGKIRSFIHWLW